MMLLEMLMGGTQPSSSQTFTSSGSFTVPNNVGYISAAAVGAGGAGCGGTASYSGSGGSGGALVYGNNIPVTPGETLTVTVGTGGTSSSSSAGTNGGYSEISRGGTVLLRANGGNGGQLLTGTVVAGRTTAGASANIGGYTYNQAGGNGGAGGYALAGGGGGGGGAGGYSSAGGAGGTENSLSYVSGLVYQPFTVNGTSVGGVTYNFVQGPYITTTTDFSTFTPRVNSGSTFYNILRESSTGNNIAVGAGGMIYTGAGSSWTARSSGVSNALYGILFADPIIFIGGDSGVLLYPTSPLNYSSWSTVSSGTSETILCGHAPTTGAYAMMGGSNGLILLRTDVSPVFGGTWTAYSTGGTDSVRSITDNGSVYVAVGQNGSIYTSTNQTSWTSRSSGTSNFLFKVMWYANYFWVVGANGTLLKSSDGTTWTSLSLGFADDITSILNPDTFISSNILYQTGMVPMAGESGAWLNSYININSTGSNGSGGSGGGGAGSSTERGGGGGGIALSGTGTSGTGGVYSSGNVGGGTGGSSGSTGSAGVSNSSGGNGGNYGAGGSGAPKGVYAGGNGANGAVRIIWGPTKSYPSNAS